METLFATIVCIALLLALVYFVYALVYEIGLAIYHRLPLQVRDRIDRVFTRPTHRAA